MARIRPFRALRYDPQHVGAVSRLLVPLVDSVTAVELERLYRLPEHAIHLALPQSLEAAITTLATWRKDGILAQDPLPGIYPYYQQYSLFGSQQLYLRKGFLCLVRLVDDEGKPEIYLHEDTIPSSIRQRMALLAATQLNIAPTHGFYHDPTFALEPLMDACLRWPSLTSVDSQGVVHKLGMLQNFKDIRQFQQVLAGHSIFMADGHHRLETSLRYRQAYMDAHPDADPEDLANYHLIYLSNSATDEMRILPTHRVVQLLNSETPSDILARLSGYFDIEPSDQRRPLFQDLQGHQGHFGLILGGVQYLMRLKPGLDRLSLIELDLPESVRRLDYTVLHYLVLDRVLGIPYVEQADSPRIQYLKDYARVIDLACDDAEYMGLLVGELKLEQLLEVAQDHARMPPKSTYFYPKVLCGLVYASLADADNNTLFDSGFGLAPAETATGAGGPLV